jgi:hypothetical protein
MNLQTTANVKSESIKEKIRKDLRYCAFYLSPLLNQFDLEPLWLANTHGLTEEIAAEWQQELLRSGYWRKDQDGTRTLVSKLNLAEGGEGDLSISEFLTLISQVLCRISTDGNCWAETHTIVTSLKLKREFISEVTAALSRLLENSAGAPGETMFSWAHVSIDTLKSLQGEDLL